MSNLQRIIWIASFPKSGNTWMRMLLAHYFMPPQIAPDINNIRAFTTGDVRKDFFDAALGHPYHGETPNDWIQVRPQALRLIAASKEGHHFVKTHCQAIKFNDVDLIPPEVTAAAIYIIRNPFDLAPSFARHQSCSLDDAILRMQDVNSFMGTPNGIYDALGRWDHHVQSWTNAPGLPLHVVRYEDLLARTAKSMRALLKDFLKVEISNPKLARAIKATEFSQLKKQEETLGFHERPSGMDKFFAKGRSGVWKEDLTPAQVGAIREAFLPVIEQWYPEMLQETAKFAQSA